ncbi:MAG: hypothetical protein JJLCMIEE_01099 [Acidimicrobiales bacterium]|nr:hypothetical protein [Acidimicrobiales bacterium]
MSGGTGPLGAVAGAIGTVHEHIRWWLGEPGPVLAPVVARLTTDTCGKSLRAGLVLLFAGEQRSTDQAATAGALVELIHAGSLYHDDVIDNASHRRGSPSANAEFGAPMAITCGDFLLARASLAAASLGGEVARWSAETVTELCRGQSEEMASTGDTARTAAQYWSAVDGKTASLMALACRLGAWCAPHLDQEPSRAALSGLRFGSAFQLVDDLLDLCGPATELGRVPGSDLSQQVFTLPVILGLAADPGLLGELPAQPAAAAAEVASRLSGTGVLDAVRSEVAELLDSSLDVLTGLAVHAEMVSLADWLLGRADRALGAACERR